MITASNQYLLQRVGKELSAIRNDHYYSDLERKVKDFIIAGNITDPLAAERAATAPNAYYIISGSDMMGEVYFPHVLVKLLSSGTEALGAGFTSGGAMQQWAKLTLQILVSGKLNAQINTICDEIRHYILSNLKTLHDTYKLHYRGESDYRLPFDVRAKVHRRSIDFSFNYFDIRT